MKIDENKLTKYSIQDQEHINENGEGVIIKNDVENIFTIKGKEGLKYLVEIYDEHGNLRYNHLLNKDETIKLKKFDYIFYLKRDNEIIQRVGFNPENKKILLHLDSYALGDTIAWMAYINDYYEKYKPKELIVTNFWNNLFKSPNPNIKLIGHYNNYVGEVYSTQFVGYDKYTNQHRNKNLQEIICKLMGLSYKEKKPLINIPKNKLINNKKYICISEYASSRNKQWLYPYGWQIVVNYLKSMGYDILVISKEKTCLYNVIDKTGNMSILERVAQLRNCEFFIGVSSGLSWLSWALNKKTIMISGLTKPYNEFYTDYRIINKNVCYGCFNRDDLDHSLECPVFEYSNKKLECSHRITPEMVIETINKIILNRKLNN